MENLKSRQYLSIDLILREVFGWSLYSEMVIAFLKTAYTAATNKGSQPT